MLRSSFIFYVILPLVGLEGYLLSVHVLGADRNSALFAENGLFELGTAAFFFLAGSLAFCLCLRSRGVLANRCRAYFLAFALAGWFVSLEELSYGQHLFGWSSPQWFAANSSKQEFNLHNLHGDRLSEILRESANVVFPVGCVVLPLVFMVRDRSGQPDHWSYYVLPKTELLTSVLVGQALTVLENISKMTIGSSMLVRPGEVQEFFWAMGTAIYASVMYRRLVSGATAATVDDRADDGPQVIPFERRQIRKAA